jgi:hypothetical protein
MDFIERLESFSKKLSKVSDNLATDEVFNENRFMPIGRIRFSATTISANS